MKEWNHLSPDEILVIVSTVDETNVDRLPTTDLSLARRSGCIPCMRATKLVACKYRRLVLAARAANGQATNGLGERARNELTAYAEKLACRQSPIAALFARAKKLVRRAAGFVNDVRVATHGKPTIPVVAGESVQQPQRAKG